MKFKLRLLPALVLLLAVTAQSCKTKKPVTTPTPPAPVAKEAPAEEKKPESTPAPEAPRPEPAPAKPNFNFSNIQFEFNSAVLKTGSYELLDKMSVEMKKDPAAKFVLNGHSSAEGTDEHNMSLSVDRANSVRSYLINAGVDGDRLTTKGYGESKPLTTNKTEEGRALNRRVEVKLVR